MNTLMVVDDNGGTLRTIKKMLEPEYKVLLASSGPRALTILQKEMPDLIILDVLMPEMDGFETYNALRKLEKKAGRKQTPVIFLTAEHDSEVEQKGLKLGASDFIRKPFNEEILLKRIQNSITNSKTIENLTKEATVDKLTGFLNKSNGTAKISDLCEEYTGTLAVMDLDNFKLVNDLSGHDAGDRVLQMFSDIVKRNTRETDVISRIGGDEFLAFFPGVIKEGALSSLVKRLNQQLVDEVGKLLGEDNGIPIGISLGAVMIPNHGRDYESLFALADSELYKVKQNGKHGYSVYKGVEPVKGQESENLEHEMARISKILEERNDTKGAFILGKESFSIVSRFIMRFYKRYGGSYAKILFAITTDDAQETHEITSQFGLMLQKTLRNSDLILQTRLNQFFVVLTERNNFEINTVVKRILEKWEEMGYGEGVKVNYTAKLMVQENPRLG